VIGQLESARKYFDAHGVSHPRLHAARHRYTL
jgi:hypothetical protein